MTASSPRGKVAIVIGGAEGIGSGIARRIASGGHMVVVAHSQSRDAGEALADEITVPNREGVALRCDVTRGDDVSALFEGTRGRFGRLDLVVKKAGVIIAMPIVEATDEKYEAVFASSVDPRLSAAPRWPAAGYMPRARRRSGHSIRCSSEKSATAASPSVRFTSAPALTVDGGAL